MKKTAATMLALVLASAALAQDGATTQDAATDQQTPADVQTTTSATTQPQGQAQTWTTTGGVQITVVDAGGNVAADGDTVWVHYVGRIQDGPIFDSSQRHGRPIDFVLGQGRVIPGWEEGIKGMSVGEKRELIIPPIMGYGEAGMPAAKIPPNATLVFDVELVGLRKARGAARIGEMPE